MGSYHTDWILGSILCIINKLERKKKKKNCRYIRFHVGVVFETWLLPVSDQMKIPNRKKLTFRHYKDPFYSLVYSTCWASLPFPETCGAYLYTTRLYCVQAPIEDLNAGLQV